MVPKIYLFLFSGCHSYSCYLLWTVAVKAFIKDSRPELSTKMRFAFRFLPAKVLSNFASNTVSQTLNRFKNFGVGVVTAAAIKSISQACKVAHHPDPYLRVRLVGKGLEESKQ